MIIKKYLKRVDVLGEILVKDTSGNNLHPFFLDAHLISVAKGEVST